MDAVNNHKEGDQGCHWLIYQKNIQFFQQYNADFQLQNLLVSKVSQTFHKVYCKVLRIT